MLFQEVEDVDLVLGGKEGGREGGGAREGSDRTQHSRGPRGSSAGFPLDSWRGEMCNQC